MKIQIILFVLLLTSPAFSKSVEPSLQQILSKLSKSPMVTFEVEKKTKSELLGNETNSPGTIYLSAKKFRWDTEGNEKSKIIYDGKVIWTIQEPPKGFKAPPQITKMKLDKKSESQVFINSLFQENFNSQFKLTKTTKSTSKNNMPKNIDAWDFHLKPLQKNLGVDELKITVDEKREIKEISYVDEIQNKIAIAVNKTTLSKKTDAKLFQYKPPVGAQVNEL